MTVLVVGASIVTAVGLVWCAHQANARIKAWGENMNEIDRIFQTAGEMDEGVQASWGAGKIPATHSFLGSHLKAVGDGSK